MATPAATLETPRLTLSLMSLPDDLAFRQQLFKDWFEPGDPEANKWSLKVINAFLEKTAENHLRAAPNGPVQASYTVALKPSAEFPEGRNIGAVNFFFRGEGTTPGELGFSFLKSHQGQGYGTESIAEVVRHLTQDQGIKELYACTAADNVRCQKTLQKLGFERGGHVIMDGLVEGKGLELLAFVLPGMKPLEGQRLTWVGSQMVFDEVDEV